MPALRRSPTSRGCRCYNATLYGPSDKKVARDGLTKIHPRERTSALPSPSLHHSASWLSTRTHITQNAATWVCRRAGDKVTLVFDGYAGTLAFWVNGSSQGVCFSGLQSATIYPAIATYLTNRGGRILRAEAMPALPPSVIAPAFATFDPGRSSSGGSIRFSESNTVVTSTSGTNSMAVCPRGFGRCKAIIEYRCERDVNSSQGLVYGVALACPPTSFDYTNEGSGLYLRAYNGQIYGPSRHRAASSNRARVNQGEIVALHWDGVAGTIRYFINGADQGIVFNNLSSATIYPAVGTYISDRSAKLVRAEEVTEFTGAGAVAVSAVVPTGAVIPFDSARSSPSSNITLGEGGRMMTSRNGTNSLATTSRGFSRCRAVFEYAIVKDEAR